MLSVHSGRERDPHNQTIAILLLLALAQAKHVQRLNFLRVRADKRILFSHPWSDQTSAVGSSGFQLAIDF